MLKFSEQPEGGEDMSAYRPASELCALAGLSYKKFTTILKRQKIRTDKRSSSQRLWVHAGDWQEYLAKSQQSNFDSLDATPEDISAAIADANKRQAALREKKKAAGEKKTTSPLLAKLLGQPPAKPGKL